MKTRNIKLLWIALTPLACQSNQNQQSTSIPHEENTTSISQLKEMSWLIGRWENRSDHGLAIEFWKQKTDSSYSGQSFFIKNGNTVSFETIELEQKGEQLYYTPTVRDQNNAKPIEFNLISLKNNQFVFENKKHDFPQIITYSKVTNDSVVVVISGTINEHFKSQAFPFKRTKTIQN